MNGSNEEVRTFMIELCYDNHAVHLNSKVSNGVLEVLADTQETKTWLLEHYAEFIYGFSENCEHVEQMVVH